MMNTNERNEILQLFEEFLKTMELLRAKCPWDAKQTIPSLRQYTIEEVFELADAIVEKSWEDVRKELGDILMHIVFYSLIANEEGKFSLADVLRGENDKLIYRHPHVFDPSSRLTAREVEEQWEDLKIREGNGHRRVLEGVPRSLPPITKALRIQEKASAAGLDWEEKSQVWGKVEEELTETRMAEAEEDHRALEGEIGDLLFSVINAARLYGVDPSMALERTNKKFIHRFNYVEAGARSQGKTLREMQPSKLDALWEAAKAEEKDAKIPKQ